MPEWHAAPRWARAGCDPNRHITSAAPKQNRVVEKFCMRVTGWMAGVKMVRPSIIRRGVQFLPPQPSPHGEEHAKRRLEPWAARPSFETPPAAAPQDEANIFAVPQKFNIDNIPIGLYTCGCPVQ